MLTTDLAGFTPLKSGSPHLYRWTVPGDGTSLILREGSAGFLLLHFATRFDRRVEDLTEPVLDDWGHAFRVVRGYVTQLSRHAYGLAEDLNATDHPLGVDHTFTPHEVDTIHTLLRTYDGCLRWGGDYFGRLDPMHIEVDRPLSDCEHVARRLADTPRGRLILAANPTQRKVIFS